MWIFLGEGFAVTIARGEMLLTFLGLIVAPLIAAFLAEKWAAKDTHKNSIASALKVASDPPAGRRRFHHIGVSGQDRVGLGTSNGPFDSGLRGLSDHCRLACEIHGMFVQASPIPRTCSGVQFRNAQLVCCPAPRAGPPGIV